MSVEPHRALELYTARELFGKKSGIGGRLDGGAVAQFGGDEITRRPHVNGGEDFAAFQTPDVRAIAGGGVADEDAVMAKFDAAPKPDVERLLVVDQGAYQAIFYPASEAREASGREREHAERKEAFGAHHRFGDFEECALQRDLVRRDA